MSNNNVIIGTAGHIDHGKTSLIQRLTGVDTDRLKEEKLRGITIELGFAEFALPSGIHAGIVDVPGHEKFVKNMMAGASGMDIVLLVVAADEGLMPQTKEHIDIIKFMDVKKGIVVLNKIDLADPDLLELVEDDLKETLEDTIFENADVLKVSAATGEGMDDLISVIDSLAQSVDDKDLSLPGRLNVDRVFSIKGFGTIVTGTLLEGVLKVGMDVSILPKQIISRIRKIQVHSKEVDQAYSGQRVALNLADFAVSDLSRGDVVYELSDLPSSMMIDVRLKLLPDAKELKHWCRLRVYIGTREVFGRLALLDREVLKGGEEVLCQLRLESELAVKRNDPFVIRSYSPLVTIGGGVIIDSIPKKHKRFNDDVLESLSKKAEGTPEELLETFMIGRKRDFPNHMEILDVLDQDEKILNDLIDDGVLMKFTFGYIHRLILDDIENEWIQILNEYHMKHSLRNGMPKEELRSKTLKNMKMKLFNELINAMVEVGMIKVTDNDIGLSSFKIKLDDKQIKKKERILNLYDGFAMNPLVLSEVYKKLGIDKSDQMLNYLKNTGDLIVLNDTLLLSANSFKLAYDILNQHFESNDQITLSEYRDLLGSSRKVTMALLEYFDRNKITKRVEEYRIKLGMEWKYGS